MSKQPLASQQRLRLLRREIALPGDPRQLWILVRMEPRDNAPGEFFVTHARNFEKFEKRPGFTVIAHSPDSAALAIACRRATQAAGPAYQPQHSAARPENAPRSTPNMQGLEPTDPASTWEDDDSSTFPEDYKEPENE